MAPAKVSTQSWLLVCSSYVFCSCEGNPRFLVTATSDIYGQLGPQDPVPAPVCVMVLVKDSIH